jgi:predicted nucleic acid-binding protein
MIVIADTTPINHLVLLGKEAILHELYGRVMVPAAVLAELRVQAAPPAVRHWIANPPAWLEVRRLSSAFDSSLPTLDAGEREAILLAEELRADLLLMDDLGGRREAQRRRIKVAGTLTVLLLGTERGLIEDFPVTLQQLQETGFRASPKLIEFFLDRYAEWRRGKGSG